MSRHGRRWPSQLVSTSLLERDANARFKTPASTCVTGDFLSSSVSCSVKMPTGAGARRELVYGVLSEAASTKKGIQSGTRHSEVDNGYPV